MKFNQFGMTKSIVSGVNGVDVRNVSILHEIVVRRNQYLFQFFHVKITPSITGVKKSKRASNPLIMTFVMQS